MTVRFAPLKSSKVLPSSKCLMEPTVIAHALLIPARDQVTVLAIISPPPFLAPVLRWLLRNQSQEREGANTCTYKCCTIDG